MTKKTYKICCMVTEKGFFGNLKFKKTHTVIASSKFDAEKIAVLYFKNRFKGALVRVC